MSTRSRIGIKQGESVKSIYCHSDGYLDYNGLLLFKHYNTKEKVEELLSLGDASFLTPNLHPDPDKPHSFDYNERQEGVSIFYGRDRGEEGIEAKTTTLKRFIEIGEEYAYLFDPETGKWSVYETWSSKKFEDLEEALIREGVDLNEEF